MHAHKSISSTETERAEESITPYGELNLEKQTDFP